MVTRAILGCLLIFFLASADYGITAGNASFMFSPNTGSYQVGNNFNVDILLNTDGQDVVAVAAYVKYDPTHFRVNSIETAGSLFTVEAEREIDSSHGLIKITRGKPTPGVNTVSGKVASMNLTALAQTSPNTDNVTFVFGPGSASGSAVIQDDGLGTSILGTVVNARFAVSPEIKISLQTPSSQSVFNSCSLLTPNQPKFSWDPNGTLTTCTVLFSISPVDFSRRGILIGRAAVRGTSDSWTPPISLWKNILIASDNTGNARPVYWKVTGMKPDRTAVESEVWSFSIGNPQVVAIGAPDDGASLPVGTTPTFIFDSNCNTKFRLEFSPLGDFSDPTKIKGFIFIVRDPNVEKTLQRRLTPGQWMAVKQLIGAGTGYFRVKAWDGIKRETISATRLFTVQ
jgi:hypothetical protein